jgi:phosphoglycolate phosphatase-like HAD superfamily hydrolase
MTDSIVHALDFDGVICDSAIETAVSGWKAASEIWTDMGTSVAPAAIDQFKAVRPVIETGYEAILAMRLLCLGESASAIYANYADKTQALIEQSGATVAELKTRFATVRDHWIADDLPDWVSMNPLFPGIKAKLQGLAQSGACYIVTTKQERFVQHILAANDVDLAQERIFGLDRNLSKPEILMQIQRSNPNSNIVFTEDRLQALLNVAKHPDLGTIKLCFASWGYNTTDDKAVARKLGFAMPSLDEFLAN